jgi:hypothetical protein
MYLSWQPNHPTQGCQMVCFQTKNPNLGKFWTVLDGKCLHVLWPFGIFYGDLRYFMTIWYILYSFGTFFWYFVPIKIWQPWPYIVCLIILSTFRWESLANPPTNHLHMCLSTKIFAVYLHMFRTWRPRKLFLNLFLIFCGIFIGKGISYATIFPR